MQLVKNKNEVQRFASRMLIFFATIAVLDFVCGKLLEKKYWALKKGYDRFTTYAITKAAAPILIFGSSRAMNNFNPAVLKNELNLPGYNAGRVGQSIFYHYALLKAALKRYTPQMVILSMDAGDFAKAQKDYDRLAQLLPYYREHPEIRELVDLKGPYEKIKMLSYTYPYNSLLLPIVKDDFNKKKDEQNPDGFLPLDRKAAAPFHKIDYSDFATLDSNKINIYRRFIKECKEAGIALYIVCPPYRVDATGSDSSLALAETIAKENNIHFFDYSRDTYYASHTDYFADFRHLNKDGAAIFSRQVAQRIKENALKNIPQ